MNENKIYDPNSFVVCNLRMKHDLLDKLCYLSAGPQPEGGIPCELLALLDLDMNGHILKGKRNVLLKTQSSSFSFYGRGIIIFI